MYTLYSLTFPNSKMYIGYTSRSLKERFRKHKSLAKNGSKYAVHNAIRKYNFNVTCSEICKVETLEQAYKKEQTLIALWETKTPLGYNLTDGGEGTQGHKPSIEKTEKHKLFLKEYFQDSDVIKRISDNKKEFYKNNPERKREISEQAKLRMSDPKRKQFVSKWSKEYFSNRENRIKQAKARGTKPFSVYKLNGEFIGIFVGKVLCAEELKISQSGVSMCLSGKLKQHKGYTFKYVEE